MAVQSDTSRIQYAGNNSTTTSYAVPFVFQENTHLKAIARTSAGVESVVTLTNHTGAGNVNGGTVRTAVAVPATSTLTIYREVPATQTTTYAEGGDFPAASHERALDKLTYLVQQLGRAVARCVRLTDAAPESSAIPAVANQFFATDSNGAITMVAGVNAAPESITNASISPTAAIAGTKIAPNFGSQNVATTGDINAGNVALQKALYCALDVQSGSVQSQFAANAGGSTDIRSVSNHPIGFSTNNIERMRIDASGNVGIGTASPATRLHVDGTIRYTSRPVAGTITAIGFDANGDLRAASSSLRYKHNVEPYAKGLAEVAQLEPVTFNYNGEELVNAGLIVEDLDELGLEEFVLRDAEGTADAIPYGNMVALLINAIKELKVRVEELEAAQ